MIVTDTLFSKLLKSFVAFCAIATLGITASTPAFADQTSKSLDVNLTLGNSISVRILDSTATSDLSLLSFDLTPTAAGVTSTKRAIVDVSTSNITGYKLYVEANGKDHNNQYTTDLVQGDTADSHVIPTSTSTASNKNFWNYVNPATSTATVVPAHGTPDQIGYLLEPTTSTKANVDINVGVDTTITAGSYTNQLLFTAIANAESIDYTLYFDKNAPSGVDPSDIENFPVNQTASASATSYTFTIPDTAPSLVGYTFGGYVDPTATPGSKGSSADPYLPGDDVTVVADPSASVISGTKTLNAQWQPLRTVTVTAGTGIASTTGSGDYSPGANVSIGATLSAGYHFADPKWTVNSGGVTISNDSFTMPDNDVSVTANGAINTCPITYNSNAPSGTTASGSMSDSSMTYNQAVTLTSNAFSITGYTFLGWAETASGSVVFANGATLTAAQTASYCGTHNTTKNLYAKWDNHYTLTVNPNGGTWGGSTSSQNFQQEYNSTKTIGNPTANATYTIGYNANGQGATYSGSPTSVERPFDSWSLSGAGSFAGGTYTYGAGNGTLTAQYNTTSNIFTLPTITKSGSTCYWAKGSASGTLYASGATYVTIDSNTTFYAVCKAETLAAACLNASNGDTFTVNNITYVKENGYCYTTSSRGNSTFTNAASLCPSGTSVPSSMYLNYYSWTNYADTSKQYWSSTSQTQQGSNYYYLAYQSGQQQQGSWQITTTSNPQESKAVICMIDTDSAYSMSVDGRYFTKDPEYPKVEYGGYTTVEITPNSGFYLKEVSCPSGYTCSGYNTSKQATGKQTIVIKNNNTSSGGTLSIVSDPVNNPWENITTMQQMTSALCTAAPTDWGMTLKDSRDQTDYTVMKLQDGKCWMTDDLKLYGPRTLSNSDSDVQSSFSLYAPATGTWCTTNSSSCIDKSQLTNGDSSAYGYYYNWYTATAGSGTRSTSSGSDVGYSICPKGWRLPTSTEFNAVVGYYTAYDSRWYFPLGLNNGGYRSSTSSTYKGSRGYYWTSTSTTTSGTARAPYYAQNGSNSPNNTMSEFYGLPVRCVARS